MPWQWSHRRAYVLSRLLFTRLHVLEQQAPYLLPILWKEEPDWGCPILSSVWLVGISLGPSCHAGAGGPKYRQRDEQPGRVETFGKIAEHRQAEYCIQYSDGRTEKSGMTNKYI